MGVGCADEIVECIAWSILGTGKVGEDMVVFDANDQPIGDIQSITLKADGWADFVISRPYRLGGGLGHDESGRYIREGV